MTCLRQTPSNLYSQQGDLVYALQMLSRLFSRMQIPHAVIGKVALALHGYAQRLSWFQTESCPIPCIDFLVTQQGFLDLQTRLLHQRFVQVEGCDRLLWDSRTGYILQVYLVDEGTRPCHPLTDPCLDPMLGSVVIEGVRTLPLDCLVQESQDWFAGSALSFCTSIAA